MATTTGTATDYLDLMIKFRDYVISAPAGSHWVTERNDVAGDYEMIFKGDGGATDEIFFGIRSYFNATDGYYNWELRGYTGYLAGADFDAQPGVSLPSYIPLQNTIMTYWFFVTGRRVCMIVKTGTAYQFMYAGFFDQFATADEYPYPMLVMGSSWRKEELFNGNYVGASSSHSPSGSGSNSSAYLRMVDGQWYTVMNHTGTGGQEVTVGAGPIVVWPLAYHVSSSDPVLENRVVDTYNARTLLHSNSPGGVPNSNLLPTENGAGTPAVPLLPATLYMLDPSRQFLGEIHNIYWCSYGGGVTAEDVITDGISADTFMVFQNIHRTDTWTGVAIREE